MGEECSEMGDSQILYTGSVTQRSGFDLTVLCITNYLTNLDESALQYHTP